MKKLKQVQLSNRASTVACTILVVLVVMVIAGLSASAQDSSTKSLPGLLKPGRQTEQQAPASPANPAKHTLSGTYFDSSFGLQAFCNTVGCTALGNLYTENIVCPGATGVKCTFEIHIESPNEVAGNSQTPGEVGIYQFLINGAIPAGGGTDNQGYYVWQEGSPINLTPTSYVVSSQVQNNVANQLHQVAVNIGCIEATGDPLGCIAASGPDTLTVRVFKP